MMIESDNQLALAYKRAIHPVLNTIRKMLKADAVLLWQIYDEAERVYSKDTEGNLRVIKPGVHEIHTEEKTRLCKEFYKWLVAEKQLKISEISHSPEIDTPEKLAEKLNGKYSILKYVEAITDAEKFEALNFDYGEDARPRKYVVLDDAFVKGWLRDQSKQSTSGGGSKSAKKDASVKPKVVSGKKNESSTGNRKLPDISTFVKLEGITSYHARIKETGLYSKKNLLETYSAHSIGLNHDRIRVKRKDRGTPIDRCDQLIIIPIKIKDQVIGVLKVEYYNEGVDFEAEDFQTILDKVETYAEFFAEFIENSKEGVKSLTYRQLCRGDELLDVLIDYLTEFEEERRSQKNKEDKDSKLDSVNTSKDMDVIEKVLNGLTHIFHVFERGTYIGWAEIAKRIDHFVQEISSVLGLPRKGLLSEFDKLRRYEELLLDEISQYRDHFIHQFHTFALGFIIILRIGVEKFGRWANNQLKVRKEYFQKDFDELDTRSVLRIWFLISFYHDYAYILQRFDNTMSKFVKDVLRLNNFDIRNDWSQIFFNQEDPSKKSSKRRMSEYLINLSNYFVSGELYERDFYSGANKKEISQEQVGQLIDQIWFAILKTQDHGPLSALYLLDLFLKESKEIKRRDEQELYLAALAIACHHENVFEKVAFIGSKPFITLEGMPFLFLLIYCDTAQEWGRRKKDQLETPWLQSVHIDVKGKNTISTSLSYDPDDLNIHPTRDDINRIVSQKLQTFKSRNYRFIINYKIGKRPEKSMGKNNKSESLDHGSEISLLTSISFDCIGDQDFNTENKKYKEKN